MHNQAATKSRDPLKCGGISRRAYYPTYHIHKSPLPVATARKLLQAFNRRPLMLQSAKRHDLA